LVPAGFRRGVYPVLGARPIPSSRAAIPSRTVRAEPIAFAATARPVRSLPAVPLSRPAAAIGTGGTRPAVLAMMAVLAPDLDQHRLRRLLGRGLGLG
jgi:hypothetical protein